MARAWLTPVNSVLRLGDGDGPEFRLSGDVVRVEHLAFLVGFAGHMKPGDAELVYRELARTGAKVALARRLAHHRMPHARLLSLPLIGDWFVVDLSKFA